jgi:hypothetical protein
VAGFELALFTKAGAAPLTKHIALDDNGGLVNDSSACSMAAGAARRLRFRLIDQLAEQIAACTSSQAIALGRLVDGLPDEVRVVTKHRLNGAAAGTIARTTEHLVFAEGEPAVALLDFDAKGMPGPVRTKIADLGGVWPAYLSVCPGLAAAMRISRSSTSAGLYRSDTLETFPGSGGEHHYLAVRDGSDIERFLATLHDRCWLVGLGWLIVGVAGQFLERSPVDRMVGRPERLCFEGSPELEPPLAQDLAARKPVVVPGELLDTRAACPPLTPAELARLQRLKEEEKARLRPDSAAARQGYIGVRAAELVARTGMPAGEAKQIIERQTGGVLLPPVVLPFDDPDLAGATAADVLADAARYVGETLADPLEGLAYGRDKAMVLERSDGGLIIHSFAHGRIIYRLLFDFAAAESAVRGAAAVEAAKVFVHVVMNGELDAAEVERLRNLAAELHDVGKRSLNTMLKAAKAQAAAARAATQREERLATGAAGRATGPVPRADAEWLPVMADIDQVLEAVRQPFPPLRDIEHDPAETVQVSAAGVHLLTSEESNPDDADEQEDVR